MELYVDRSTAENLISISKKYGIDARIVGYCEASAEKKLTIKSAYGEFHYQ